MDIALSVFSGAVCKVYDDLTDNHLSSNALLLEYLKGLEWSSLALLSFQDFTFAVTMYLMNLINAIHNPREWSLPYEHSMLLLYPLFIAMSYNTGTPISIWDGYIFACSVFHNIVEPYFFSEEFSSKKFVLRFWYVLSFAVGFLLPGSHSIKKLMAYGMGYMFVSTLFQAYLLISESQRITLDAICGQYT